MCPVDHQQGSHGGRWGPKRRAYWHWKYPLHLGHLSCSATTMYAKPSLPSFPHPPSTNSTAGSSSPSSSSTNPAASSTPAPSPPACRSSTATTTSSSPAPSTASTPSPAQSTRPRPPSPPPTTRQPPPRISPLLLRLPLRQQVTPPVAPRTQRGSKVWRVPISGLRASSPQRGSSSCCLRVPSSLILRWWSGGAMSCTGTT